MANPATESAIPLSDNNQAFFIGIRRETLYVWKNKYPNISNALKKGKEVVDRLVENALLISCRERIASSLFVLL